MWLFSLAVPKRELQEVPPPMERAVYSGGEKGRGAARTRSRTKMVGNFKLCTLID